MLRVFNIHMVIFFFLVSIFSYAQDQVEVTFEVKLSKEKLGLNERLRVEFQMNKDGDNFSPPDFEDFNIVMGPAQQISSSWINGKRSFNKSYSYVLEPKKQGVIEIGQASIEIAGNTYKTVPKQVTITAAVDNPNAPKTANDIAEENIHLIAEVSKGNPYLNEAVTVVYKLFVSPDIRVNNFRPLDNPKYNNFWSQDIPVKRYDPKNETFQGKNYRSVILKRVVLYPQKSGQLSIAPLTIELYVDVPTNKRDFFGSPVYRSATTNVSAGSRTLNVKALPIQGKPANFSGAVGDFDFSVSTSKTALNASESLQAKVEITGKGNLKLFQLPEPALPSSLEVYEPEYDEKVTTTLSGMEGKVANNYTIVPSYRGKYPIPSIEFSFFNPKTETYQTLSSQEITIDVLEGPEGNDVAITNSQNAKVLVPTGKQFHFIKTTTNFSATSTNYLFGTTKFYAYLFGPLVLIPLFILWRRKKEKDEKNVEGTRLKKVNKLARKYLSAAKKALGNKEEFYVALEKALHNYLKAKLKIETSDFSKDKINSLLLSKNVDEGSIEKFIQLLKNCEMARYSPFTQVQMEEDYNEASDVISKLDKQL